MATTTIVTFKTIQTSVKIRQGMWNKTTPKKEKMTDKVNETEVRTYIKNLIVNKINTYHQDDIIVYFNAFDRVAIDNKEYGFELWSCQLKNGNLSTCNKHTFDGRHTSVWQTICFFKGYQQKLNIDQMFYEVVEEILAERKKSVA